MSARRNELTRAAARLFAEKGYHGTSIGDLAQALGVQKGSLYAHIESKADLLWEVASEGAAAFHAGLDRVPDEGPVVDRIRAALRAHLRVVSEHLVVAAALALAAPASADQQPSPPGQSLSPEVVPGAGLSGVAGVRAARYRFVHAAGVTSAGSFRIDFAAGPGNKIVLVRSGMPVF